MPPHLATPPQSPRASDSPRSPRNVIHQLSRPWSGLGALGDDGIVDAFLQTQETELRRQFEVWMVGAQAAHEEFVVSLVTSYNRMLPMTPRSNVCEEPGVPFDYLSGPARSKNCEAPLGLLTQNVFHSNGQGLLTHDLFHANGHGLPTIANMEVESSLMPTVPESDAQHSKHLQIKKTLEAYKTNNVISADKKTIGAEMEARQRRSLLRDQYDRLIVEGQDQINFNQLSELVEKYSDQKIDREALVKSLKALHQIEDDEDLDNCLARYSRTGEELNRTGSLTSMNSARNSDLYISFEDFAQLMSADDELADSTSRSIFTALRNVFDVADTHHRELARRAQELRDIHHGKAFLLDLIPAPVIILNAMMMGLRADIDPDATFWKVCDILFMLFYTGEALAKCNIFGFMVYFCGPEKIWNGFDQFCILVSFADFFMTYLFPLVSSGDTVDINGLMLMKMLRLCKLARLVKALRYPFFDELKAMIFGVVSGMRVLLWAIVLLFVIIFFLGVIMQNIVGLSFAEFETVPKAMFSVFRCFTDGCAAYDGTPLQEHLRDKYGAIFILCYSLSFMLVTFGIFNLIMATFIENVVTTTAQRKQSEIGLSGQHIRCRLQEMFSELIINGRAIHGKRCHLLTSKQRNELEKEWRQDVNKAFLSLPNDLEISREVFELWVNDSKFTALLHEADIEQSNPRDVFDCLDADLSGELTLTELIEGLLELRGPITKSDIISIRLKSTEIVAMLQKLMTEMAALRASDAQRQKAFAMTSANGIFGGAEASQAKNTRRKSKFEERQLL